MVVAVRTQQFPHTTDVDGAYPARPPKGPSGAHRQLHPQPPSTAPGQLLGCNRSLSLSLQLAQTAGTMGTGCCVDIDRKGRRLQTHSRT